tara:strand:- start:322 stop:801 length:480 start_codon:yes stop_codon:yes gene_type:complete
MGILQKAMFWKKDDDFDFDKDLGSPNLSDPGEDLGGSKTADLGKGPDLNVPSLEGESMPSQPKDELGLPKTEYTDPAMAKMDQNSLQTPMSHPNQPPITPSAPTQSLSSEASDKHMEVISAKLDMLKISLEAVNTKLDNLTRVAEKGHDSTDRFRRDNW